MSAGTSRRYRDRHPERVKEENRAYREAHPDEIRRRIRDWRDRNPEAVRACLRANKANQTAKQHGAPGKLTAADVRAVDAAGACAICGSPDQPSIDHVVPLSRGGPNTRANLQRLCLPCNQKKHVFPGVARGPREAQTPVKGAINLQVESVGLWPEGRSSSVVSASFPPGALSGAEAPAVTP